MKTINHVGDTVKEADTKMDGKPNTKSTRDENVDDIEVVDIKDLKKD